MTEKNTQFQFDTTTFELEVGYTDENGTTHKEVEIREITGYDEEQLAKAEVRQNVGKLMTTLLASVVVRIGELTPKDMNKTKWEKVFRSLPMGDRDTCIKEIRVFTNGEELELNLKCEGCKSKITHFADLVEDIETRSLEVDALEVPFTLPKGIKNKEGQVFKEGTLRLVTGEDQEALDATARKNPGAANTELIARVVNEISGYGKIGLSDVRGMSVRDREYLIKLVNKYQFGPKFEISFSCPSCGEEIETGVHPVNFL